MMNNLAPRDVVCAAYRAANQGHYRKANSFVTPELVYETAHARRQLAVEELGSSLNIQQIN
jgi:hypothetical protein